jgi:hypothetical protein
VTARERGNYLFFTLLALFALITGFAVGQYAYIRHLETVNFNQAELIRYYKEHWQRIPAEMSGYQYVCRKHGQCKYEPLTQDIRGAE